MNRRITCWLTALMITAAALSSCFAMNVHASEFSSPFFEEEESQPYDPYEETDPFPEFTTEPVTEEPQVWTEVPTEAETEPYYYEEETESPRDEYAQLVEDAEEPTGINSVKMDKSVSDKSYSTDYTAGIVSWICVGVGLVVVMVMLVSTKLTGRRA